MIRLVPARIESGRVREGLFRDSPAGRQLQKRGSSCNNVQPVGNILIFRFNRVKKKKQIMRTILSHLNRIYYNF